MDRGPWTVVVGMDSAVNAGMNLVVNLIVDPVGGLRVGLVVDQRVVRWFARV